MTHIAQWERIERVHAEFFGDIRLAANLVQVSRLLAPEQLIEV